MTTLSAEKMSAGRVVTVMLREFRKRLFSVAENSRRRLRSMLAGCQRTAAGYEYDFALFAGGMTVGIVIAVLAWYLLLVYPNRDIDSVLQPGRVAGMDRILADYQARMDSLDRSISAIDAKIGYLHAALNAETSADRTTGPSQHTTVAAKEPADLQALPATAAGHAQVQQTPSAQPAAADDSGQAIDGNWVINLVSLPGENHAEDFIEKARALGINAESRKVTINGKQFWRVQVPGYESAGQAESRADTVRDRLGLKDVWISRR